jgi:hypothetical protein
MGMRTFAIGAAAAVLVATTAFAVAWLVALVRLQREHATQQAANA